MPKTQTGVLKQILDELEGRVDALAEHMLTEYLASIPAYSALPEETVRQVREVNRLNLQSFIRNVRKDRPPSPEELAFLRDSATRRAREGVALAALLQAYRLGASLAWAEVRRIVEQDPARLSVGLDLASRVMRYVDEISGAVAQAYLEEHERLSADREAARRDFLEGAVSGALAPEEISARGAALGLDPSASFAVALIAPVTAVEDDDVLRGLQRRLKGRVSELPGSERSLAITRGAETVVVFSEESVVRDLRAFVDRASEELGVRLCAGIGRVHESLSELSSSYREASIALAAARGGAPSSVAVYGELMVEELLLRERGIARRLSRTILSPLDPHPELLATLVEYLRSGPSLPMVAKLLFVHPNTVSYRLARIRELTGRDPRTPAGIAELFLALRSAQLLGKD